MKINDLIKTAMGVFSSPNNLQSHNEKHRLISPTCNEFNISDIECFIKLIMEDEIIRQFLEFDRCYKLADKYLLSQAFVYFIRAHLDHSQYTRINFFAALYLAHDIEEDDENLKAHIACWGLPRLQKNNLHYFLAVRDSLWMSMDLRASVSVECCIQVMMSVADCPLWKRERSPAHGGACRDYLPDEECSNCIPKKLLFFEATDCSECYDYSSESCDEQDDMIVFQPAKKLRLTEEE